eukprot:GEMP01037095.1.p1 GENE.GEMP01037095.1~~GEMP01037095.1.p1  ORF type:complete len:175 (+),score=39.36 GEMP01037095.1:22-546(+)
MMVDDPLGDPFGWDTSPRSVRSSSSQRVDDYDPQSSRSYRSAHSKSPGVSARDYHTPRSPMEKELPGVDTVFSMARHGHHKEVEKWLQAGFDPQGIDQFGNSLFHVACQNGNKRIAKLAAKFGADMDAQNIKGNTGLHFLYAYGYPELAEYFIEKGASEDIHNICGLLCQEGLK